MNRFLKLLVIVFLFVSQACTTLKPYERVYVDDPEMQMNVTSEVSFEYYVQSVREASVTAAGEKGSGGCGCN